MNIQAVLFKVSEWNTDECRNFLKSHNIIPFKRVHVPKNDIYYIYRIIQPNYEKYIYRIKPIQKKPLIKFILRYNK